MRIRMKTLVACPEGVYCQGTEHEFPEARALHWIETGVAEEICPAVAEKFASLDHVYDGKGEPLSFTDAETVVERSAKRRNRGKTDVH